MRAAMKAARGFFNGDGRVAGERVFTLGGDRCVGAKGRAVGTHTFGAWAPLKELQKKFGFEPEWIVAVAKKALNGH